MGYLLLFQLRELRPCPLPRLALLLTPMVLLYQLSQLMWLLPVLNILLLLLQHKKHVNFSVQNISVLQVVLRGGGITSYSPYSCSSFFFLKTKKKIPKPNKKKKKKKKKKK